MTHLVFASDIAFPWPGPWVSWLRTISYGFSFDRYTPSSTSWQPAAVVGGVSLFLLGVYVAMGVWMRNRHRDGHFIVQQDWMANSGIFALYCTIIPLVR